VTAQAGFVAALARRLGWFAGTLLGVTVVTFVLLRLAPGDPAMLRYSAPDVPDAPDVERAIQAFRAEHLLDRPLALQYLHYLGPFDLSGRGHRWFGGSGETPWNGLLALDLGREYLRPSVDVAEEIGARLAITVPLALVSALLAFAIAVPLGIASALRRGSAFDAAAGLLLFALYSLPTFWAGLLLQLAFGRGGLGWLPAIGLHDKDAASFDAFEHALDTVRHSILPVVCLTYGGLAYVSRQMRSAVLDTVRLDYVRAARAKGLGERAVVMRHVVRNSLLPVLTLVGQVLPFLVGGSVVVETIFDLPGIGKYAYDSLLQREYDAVTGCVLVSAVMTIAGFAVSDLLYAWADPRIRRGSA
jgi:peptide/nickel transport system permease protein